MTSPYPFVSATADAPRQRVRDVTWDRILFQPPELLNPRLVFDPLPFRNQPVPRPARMKQAR